MNKLQIDRANALFTESLPFILDDQQYSFIQSLPPKQRLCFILRHAYSYSYKQIAETLDISITSVGYNLSIGNKKTNKLIK